MYIIIVQRRDIKFYLLPAGYGCPRELGNVAMQTLCEMAVAESLLSPQHLLTAIKAQATAQDSQVRSQGKSAWHCTRPTVVGFA